MIFTDHGTMVRHEWMPLAMANGAEWATERAGRRDRFNNLYPIRRAPLSAALWLLGAVCAAVFRLRVA